MADIVLQFANAQDVPKRLVLGKSAEAFVKQIETARSEEAKRRRSLTRSTGFPESSTAGSTVPK
jgi:hypothetical protein